MSPKWKFLYFPVKMYTSWWSTKQLVSFSCQRWFFVRLKKLIIESIQHSVSFLGSKTRYQWFLHLKLNISFFFDGFRLIFPLFLDILPAISFTVVQHLSIKTTLRYFLSSKHYGIWSNYCALHSRTDDGLVLSEYLTRFFIPPCRSTEYTNNGFRNFTYSNFTTSR